MGAKSLTVADVKLLQVALQVLEQHEKTRLVQDAAAGDKDGIALARRRLTDARTLNEKLTRYFDIGN